VKITVIIPARNEAGGIAQIISAVKNFCDEVIVVDGHSTDDTHRIAEQHGAKVVLDGGKGKGDGIRTGIASAKADILVFIDADGSHEPSDVPALVRPIIGGEADMVIASRNKGGSDEFKMDFENLIRQVGSDIATALVNCRFGTDLTDIQNGFRAIRFEVAKALELRANDFDIEEEMVIKALRKGYRVIEVPSHEYERKWGSSKLSTWKGWKFIWRLFVELI